MMKWKILFAVLIAPLFGFIGYPLYHAPWYISVSCLGLGIWVTSVMFVLSKVIDSDIRKTIKEKIDE